MGLWSYLVGPRGPKPVDQFDDPTLGQLAWSEDEEGWIGEHGGYRFVIGYSGTALPDPELLNYVRDFLGEGGATFTRVLAEAKLAHAAKFQRWWAKEFAGLTVGTVAVWMSKSGQIGCMVDLVGGEPYRSWRVAFDGFECIGFGFDT
jgi:hypothetical protein